MTTDDRDELVHTNAQLNQCLEEIRKASSFGLSIAERNEMEIVNLTPHPLNIRTTDGRIITIQPSGELARVSESREQLPVINHREGNISVTRATYGEVENLPDPEDGKIFIVSALVLARAQGRNDVFAPGLAIRDETGRVIGCDGLSAAPTT